MPEAINVTPDPRITQIVRHALAALEGAATDGQRHFAEARLIDDADSFLIAARGLSHSVGIIQRAVERFPSDDNGSLFQCRMPVEVVVRFHMGRGPGQDESNALVKAQELADVCRQVLMIDRYRGGKCSAIMHNGRLIDGTEVWGDSRILSRTSNQAFYTAAFTAEFGWREPPA